MLLLARGRASDFGNVNPPTIERERAGLARRILNPGDARLFQRTGLLHHIEPVGVAVLPSTLELGPGKANGPALQCPLHCFNFNPPDRLAFTIILDKIEPGVVDGRPQKLRLVSEDQVDGLLFECHPFLVIEPVRVRFFLVRVNSKVGDEGTPAGAVSGVPASAGVTRGCHAFTAASTGARATLVRSARTTGGR